MERVAIIGVGLIGGSLGLAWRKQLPHISVVGFDQPQVLDRAVQLGAISEAAPRLDHAVSDADVVVLAAPLSGIIRRLADIAPLLSPRTIVTDVGSVKRPVELHAREVLPPGVSFVGGHPMAGAERGGIDNADPFLFENATYVLCPTDRELGAAWSEENASFISLIQATGARILIMESERHDRIAAAVSHLPQLLAVALMNYAADLNRGDDAFLRLAAGGFRDMTRIASSPFEVWRDILVGNEGPILDALAAFSTDLQRIRNRVFSGDLADLQDAFDRAREVRETIPKNTKGFLHPLSDIYVSAEDRPGTLYELTGTLLRADLNIKDIELLRIREGAGAAFRLSFDDDATAEKALRVLREAGYSGHRPDAPGTA